MSRHALKDVKCKERLINNLPPNGTVDETQSILWLNYDYSLQNERLHVESKHESH